MLPDRRGISPPIGVALLIAIVVVLAVVSGTVIFSLSEEKESPPNAKILLEADESNSSIALVHEGGEQINGDRVEIQGAADSEALAGQNFSTTDTHQIIPVEDTVELVWHDTDGETSHVIWEGSVPEWGTELKPATATLDTSSIGGQGMDATITEGDDETVTLDIENSGNDTDSFEVSLDIGDEVSETETTADLSTGESETVSFENVTGDLPPDDYDVSVSTGDDSVSGSLTVEAPPPAAPSLSALDIAGEGTDATITEGDDETVRVDVENVGGQSGSFTVSLDIGTEVSERETTTTLAVGETETVAFESVTGDLDDGDYDVTAAAGSDSVSGTLTVEVDLPTADRSCDWVDDQTDDGTGDIKIDGIIVDCDVITDKVIEVQNGGGVIGYTESRLKTVDADDARFWGNITAEDVLNVQNGTITGDATSQTADVKLEEASVEGSVDAGKVAELTAGTVVEGDMESEKDAKVLGSSSVEGSVTSSENAKVDSSAVSGTVEATKVVEILSGSSVAGDAVSDKTVKVTSSDVSGSVASDGGVNLQDATVTGDVYVDSSSFKCSSSTINGQDCGSYTPKDPDDY